MCWKSETMLRDLAPDRPLKIVIPQRPPVITTPHELMQQGRMSGTLCLDQVEFAFSGTLQA